MQAAQSASPVLAASAVLEPRRRAIAQAIERVREIERSRGVNPGTLDAIKEIMLELAAQRELFSQEDFPPVGEGSKTHPIYRLAEDDDHRYALYLSTAEAGKKVPPHNHTTWAVIVGVQGDEENFFYQREDDGSVPGKGRLREIGREVARPGTGVTLMPEDIHHIQVTGGQATLHLHVYGLALEQLTGRVVYNVDDGTYKAINIPANIREAR